jgi:uncharacterized protein YecT (DUF1311 family)
LISLALAGLLLAAQPVDCDNALTQADMNQCAGRGAREADAELNSLWPNLVRQMQAADREGNTNGEGEKRLRAAQRAWIAYRDAQCTLEGADALGGSMETLLVQGCLEQMTRRRINELTMMMGSR